MFLLNQHFIGNLLKKYREKAKNHVFGPISINLWNITKNDTPYPVGNFATNPKMILPFS